MAQKTTTKRPILNMPSLKIVDFLVGSGMTQNPHKTTLSQTGKGGRQFPQALKAVFRTLN